ncbi:hypothetical protein ACMD2_15575 [Ananas comosus]|uniref:Uncharacterized protein n=1 Tax=Ananas comosus TaxID=4615 RepID=A0A199UFC4_ANACO|nr:hypothetical protein ACMD2_15575 [Ananas comosus]
MRTPMASRAVSGCSALAFFHLRPLVFRGSLGLSRSPLSSRCGNLALRMATAAAVVAGARHGHSLVDSVMEELRARRRIRASVRMELPSTKEFSEVKLDRELAERSLA